MAGPNPDPDEIRKAMSEQDERARVLAAFIRDQEERAEAAREAEARRHRRDRVRRGVLLATWAAVAYVWVASPSWLRVPPPAQPTTMEETRSLRLNLFLQAQKIEAYREKRGRLPWVLSEAGPPFPGIEYHRKDNRSYELDGVSDLARLRYESNTPALEFVGPAVDAIENAPERSQQP